jgi:hypothetical protein
MKNGYTILIIILVLTAVGILITTTLNFLGIDQAKISFFQKNSALALYLSTACAEEALERIRSNPSYTTRETTITIDSSFNYQCSLRVDNINPPKYIYTKSSIKDFPRLIEIRIDRIERDGKIVIGYWQEK